MEDKRTNILLTGVQFQLLIIFLAAGLLTSCTDYCEVENNYTYYEPVYTSMEEIRSSVATVPVQSLKQVGKLFFRDGYLFINEPNEGVHIIDNKNPADPKNIAFIKIPGAFDLDNIKLLSHIPKHRDVR